MKHRSHIDAATALTLILLLMVSLLTMNTGYVGSKSISGEEIAGLYPVSAIFAGAVNGMSEKSFYLCLRFRGGYIYC